MVIIMNNIYHIITTITEDASNKITINYHCKDKNSYIILSKDINFNSFNKFFPLESLWSTKKIKNSSPNSLFQQERYVCYKTIDNLEPNTKYYFKIICGNYKSDIYNFYTLNKMLPLEIISIADTQYGNNKVSLQLVEQMKSRFKDAHLILSSGDLVDFADKEDEWFNIIDNKIFNGTIFASACGDHEYWGDDSYGYTQYDEPHTYKNILHYPLNGAKDLLGTNYYIIFNRILFIFLDLGDSNTTRSFKINQEALWLDDLVTNLKNQFDYLIITAHKSLFGSKIEDSNVFKHLNPKFVPIFMKHQVDLVLSGHDHMYSRTNNIDGTIYLDLGSSGNKRRHIDESLNDGLHEKVIDLKTLNDSCASHIVIDKDNITVEVYNLNLDIIDSFIINKKNR